MVGRDTLGLILITLGGLISISLVILISAEIISLGFAVLPIGLVLIILFLVGYILIDDPGKLEWNIPYLGKVIVGAEDDQIQAEGFNRVLAVTEEESEELADSIRAIRYEFDEDSCSDLAETLKIGVQFRKQSPIDHTIAQMESLLMARDFVENSDSLELRIVHREENTLYAKLEDDHSDIVEGLEFDLYISDPISVDGEGDIVSKEVGTATVLQTDENFCHLEVVELNNRFNPGSEDPLSYITNHSPKIKFDAERTKGVDWDDLEQAHESLRDLAKGGIQNGD